MAENVREKGKQRRTDARERRRSLAAKPFEEADQAAESQDADGARAAAKKAVATALAAALAGGLAGGAKALIDRHGRGEEQNGDDDPAPAPVDESTTETDDSSAEPDADEQAEDVDENDDDDGPADEGTEDEEATAEGPTAESDETGSGANEPAEPPTAQSDDAGSRADAPAEPQRGAPAGEVGRIVRRAREQVAELLGSEIESVSGIERADGSWSVKVEVVELRRIPDTTDVLSSYDVVLDDDGNLVSLNQKRRYRRGQVEEL